MALLRHGLREGIAEPLEAESLALTLVRRALGPRTTHEAGASVGRQRLVDRAKLVLSSDLARRWTLAEIAAEVGGSPVYLTQVFQQVEGLPLYRYQLRLRLARALDLLAAVRRPHRARPGPRLLQPQPFQRRFPRGLRPHALRSSGSRRCTSRRRRKVAKDSDSGARAPKCSGDHTRTAGVIIGDEIMSERTCAACDCELDANPIKVKIGGKTVEVCCDECAKKLEGSPCFRELEPREG